MFKVFLPLLLFSYAFATELPRGGFFTQAGLLYWKASENGLSYAVKSASPLNLAKDAKVKNFDFEWDFGFNVGIGYRIPHDRWQFLLQFTSFQTHADAHKKAHGSHLFFPLWLSPASPPFSFATQLKAHWRLHLGLIDALLSKSYQPTNTLLLTPQIGIRWGSSRQKLNLEYRGGNFLNEVEVRTKNKFQGIGPYAALYGEYAFTRHFSLIAKGAANLLYGEFYLHQDEDTLDTKEKLLGLHSIYRLTSMIFEASGGLRWHQDFSCSLRRLTLDLIWDELLLFSQNQLVRFVNTMQPGQIAANQGDLSIRGIRFNIALDF